MGVEIVVDVGLVEGDCCLIMEFGIVDVVVVM